MRNENITRALLDAQPIEKVDMENERYEMGYSAAFAAAMEKKMSWEMKIYALLMRKVNEMTVFFVMGGGDGWLYG